MTLQETLNSIATLTSSVEPLLRAGKNEAVTTVVNKIVELVAKIS